MPYNPTTALLEDAVRTASDQVFAHRLNLGRQREYQRQLEEANQVLEQHRKYLAYSSTPHR